MIILLLTIVLVLTLSFLSSLHVYWAFGGQWGLEGTIPEVWKKPTSLDMTKAKGMQIATLIVATGLLMFAIVLATNQWAIEILPLKWSVIGTRVIGAIFLLRAIGDFNVFGLFKKKSDTLFAKNDTRVFVPICLFLGIGSILISIF